MFCTSYAYIIHILLQMTPDVLSPRVTPLTLTSTRYRQYMNALYHGIIQLAHIPSLSQAASKVGESSDGFSQGATAAVLHSLETTVISELVVTSTLLLPGDAEPETLSNGLLTLMYS